MLYSCAEHIGEALEECVEDGGLPPEMEKTDRDEACFFCGEKAAYVVEKREQ
ncbi:CxxH/CxxC protein [Salisediminibacterium halotolerans]|uniref:CxxH/CxxC protein n=1 Tax=Salisediminibacterium halotolerans TaxID=517425 RepID=UPI000EB417F3|nr:CxxH/CxxC protein [Salisediminibacterium halotolerans]RLJ69705.1 CxxH/CxxC protein (TIGR04129 family) [Actinophytocola xinjiangensis]RPE89763.1 CxxH/CxxC protein (TIGR04129 family) [Salisediminibacterium halotolerans]TWG32599.1 CxxH/CxxC protein (TIGR04129 family) [Salisediminibacterium halotolerans]GEL08974.1 hypothetical protein SHA02_23900 [Salisediminibacterium halotolerans]